MFLRHPDLYSEVVGCTILVVFAPHEVAKRVKPTGAGAGCIVGSSPLAETGRKISKRTVDDPNKARASLEKMKH